ncbi:hypothetical protein [Chloroflexus sp. Y-396-1]|uniref:hypothetical protein n=1 Tax=Chloroflexus sp. Y-396-1 TaxID=867845 RepID=UPI0004B2BD08|nr:hypothetical protein [Chloroflexus sp. Y-396-1]
MLTLADIRATIAVQAKINGTQKVLAFKQKLQVVVDYRPLAPHWRQSMAAEQ